MEVTLELSKKKLYEVINKLDECDKINLVKKLEKDTFDSRLKMLQKSIPSNQKISDNIVVSEVKATRYNK